MSLTSKPQAQVNQGNAIVGAYNEIDKSLSTAGFLVGVIGRKVVLTISTTTVANDTETYEHSENGTALFSLKVIYTDGARSLMLSAERIS
jgi:hypothetical protein